MIKRFALPALAVMALAGGVTMAQAAGKKHHISDTLQVRILHGGSLLVVNTGTIKDKVGGNGAVIINAVPSGDHFNYKATAFFKKGTISATGINKATQHPDNSITFTGTFKAVSGTGIFKGVTGKGTLTGSAPGADSTATYKLTGTLTY
jgi:hypothetical protein